MPGIYCLYLDRESGKTKLTRIEQKMIYWAYWLSRKIINKIRVNLWRRWALLLLLLLLLFGLVFQQISVQFSLVAQLCLTLCDTINRSMPALPVHHKLLEFTQTHAHRVSDAIQPSHPLSSPSPPAPNPSQHQGLFQRVNFSHEVARFLVFQLQHQSFQWTPRTYLL